MFCSGSVGGEEYHYGVPPDDRASRALSSTSHGLDFRCVERILSILFAGRNVLTRNTLSSLESSDCTCTLEYRRRDF